MVLKFGSHIVIRSIVSKLFCKLLKFGIVENRLKLRVRKIVPDVTSVVWKFENS